MDGHVVVSGFGTLGRQVAALLRARDVAVTIIDTFDDPDEEVHAAALGCRYLHGDASKAHYLTQADIAGARAAIFTTGNEQANLQGAIIARRLNPTAPIVLRLYDETLVRHVESIFNVNALSTSLLVTPAIISAAVGVDLLAEFELDDRVLMIYAGVEGHPDARGIALDGAALALAASPADAPVQVRLMHPHEHMRHQERHRARRTVNWAALHPARLWQALGGLLHGLNAVTWRLVFFTVLLVVLGTVVFSLSLHLSPITALYFVITTVTTVGYGDINLANESPLIKVYGILLILGGAIMLANLYTLIADFVLTARMEYLLGRRKVRLRDHAIVVGLGATGSRVAHDLHRLGVAVVAIEAHEDGEHVAAARAEFPVIIGNGTSKTILEMAGLHQAAVVITTGDDPMYNLSVALHAREMQPGCKIVLFTPGAELADTFTNLGFHFVLGAAVVAAPAFVDAALYPHVETSFAAGGQTVLISRLTLDAASPLVGRTVRDCGQALGVAPLLDGDLQFLAPDTVLQPGQRVVVLLSREHAEVLQTPAAV